MSELYSSSQVQDLLCAGQWALVFLTQTQVSWSHRFIVCEMQVSSISEAHLNKSLLGQSEEATLVCNNKLQNLWLNNVSFSRTCHHLHVKVTTL